MRDGPDGEQSQGLSDVRVVLYQTPVHASHAQENLELRLDTRRMRQRKPLDLTLAQQQLSGTDDMPQGLVFLQEQGPLEGLERDNGRLQQ